SWMRWSLFSLIAAVVLALTATAVHDAAEDEPLCCRHPSATANTSCTGPPGAAITKPSQPPATSNDTTVTTSRDQELQLPCQ
ncbi:hypothetical protein ACIBL8_27860, partial [Streptomyces sp. NPDC050523]|uniref:hypothetical protein n=1 Tax=Streptomyces sp. NPDC050523 TaxID=3365622 RepID=UPI0037B33913